MIALLIISIILLTALGLTWARSSTAAMSVLYLPVVLLISAVPAVRVPLMPDITAPAAVIYGVVLGMILRGERPFQGLRFNPVDALVVGIAISAVISDSLTNTAQIARNTLGLQFLDFVAPYFLARKMILSPEARRTACVGVIVSCAFIAMIGVIEARLMPAFFSRALEQVGLYSGANDEILWRFGLARAQATSWQPIDLGNCGNLATAMIVVFAFTGWGRLNPFTTAGLVCSCIVAATSLSFTAFLGFGVAVAIFMFLWRFGKLASFFVLPIVLGMIMVGFSISTYLTQRELGPKPGASDPLADSFWVRTMIVQQCWEIASTAGYFGHGKNLPPELKLNSVDNTYMLIAMRTGWVSLGLWIAVPVVLAIRAGRALRVCQNDSQRIPMAAGFAGVVSIMVAMYTVWFGFAYAYLWVFLLGMTVTMSDILIRSLSYRPQEARWVVPGRDWRAATRPTAIKGV
jgi:hypothetical protein